MNIDKTFEELEKGFSIPGTKLTRVMIPAADINKYGLRRKSGAEKEKDQLVFCLEIMEGNPMDEGSKAGPSYFYDYKASGVFKKALAWKVGDATS